MSIDYFGRVKRRRYQVGAFSPAPVSPRESAERWNVLDLAGENGVYGAAIPPEYTRSEFALEYYFELADAMGGEWMYPGFNKALSNQPYFAVCKRNA